MKMIYKLTQNFIVLSEQLTCKAFLCNFSLTFSCKTKFKVLLYCIKKLLEFPVCWVSLHRQLLSNEDFTIERGNAKSGLWKSAETKLTFGSLQNLKPFRFVSQFCR